MPSKKPSFGSQEYWNTRFTLNVDPFEWLEAPDALDSAITDALRATDDCKPTLLHVGCGTSLLSYHLRAHVKDPRQIHNLDYSDVAVSLGKQREHDLHGARRGENSEVFMRWDTVDLLDHTSLLAACKPCAYAAIIEKSTSDAIACSEDVYIPLPYPIAVRSYAPIDLDLRQSSEPIHPLYVMAVNLALVAKPRARWIALSYSNDRFPFVDASSNTGLEAHKFPDPHTLWKLVEKREVGGAEQEPPESTVDNVVTHRPKVLNWIYVLERTDVPLFMRGEHIWVA
ncbi:Nn.00g020760.m01.CDS01 [Neocucurbitaria sp. VM-36]